MKGRFVFLVFFFAFAMGFNGQVEAAEKEEPTLQSSSKGQSLANPVGGLVKGITGTVTKTVDHTVEATTNVVKETTSGVTATVDRTVEGTTHVVKETEKAVTDTVRKTNEQVGKVPVTKPVTETVKKVVDPVLDTVDATVATTTDTLNNSVGKVANTVDKTVKATGDLVNQIGTETGNTVGSVVVETVDTVDRVTEPIIETTKPDAEKPVVPSENPVVQPEKPIESKPELNQPIIQRPDLLKPEKQPEPSLEEPVLTQPGSDADDRSQLPTVQVPTLQIEGFANGLKQRGEMTKDGLQPEAVNLHQINYNSSDSEKIVPLISEAKQKHPEKRAITNFIKELIGQKAIFDQGVFNESEIKVENPNLQDSQMKDLERLYIAHPPVQPQQSTSVTHSGFGTGLAAVLGEVPVIGSLLEYRWNNQNGYLHNQWTLVPLGQPPKFSPFLLSRI